jgi:hypothetical protein
MLTLFGMPGVHLLVNNQEGFVKQGLAEGMSINGGHELKGTGEVMGLCILMEVCGLDTAGTVDAGNVFVDIAVFCKEVQNPAEYFIDASRRADFMTIEVVECIRVGDVVDRRGRSELDILEAFMNGGKKFKD